VFLAATLLIFAYTYLNLSRWHVRYSHLVIGWLVGLAIMFGVAVVEPPVAAAPVTTTETLDLTRDDLSLIRGIGAAGQRRLNEEGIYRYSDITGLTPAEEAELEKRLGADDGYIEQEQWREQAALLESGQIDQHRATFG